MKYKKLLIKINKQINAYRNKTQTKQYLKNFFYKIKEMNKCQQKVN